MGGDQFDEARLWQILGGIQADVATIKTNQTTIFGKIDGIARDGCAKGVEHDKDLKRHEDRLTAMEQGARVDADGAVIQGDSIPARTSRRHVLVAAGAGAGAGGAFLLLQMVFDFLLKLHAK